MKPPDSGRGDRLTRVRDSVEDSCMRRSYGRLRERRAKDACNEPFLRLSSTLAVACPPAVETHGPIAQVVRAADS